MTSDHVLERTDSIRLPGLWVVVTGVHIAAAAYAWQMLPHGFSAGHPRFWTNQVLPFALVAFGAACLFGLWRRKERLAALAISVFVAMHVAMAIAWIVVFPITGKRPALIAAVVALVLCACAVASLRRARGLRVSVAIGAAIGLVFGSLVPWSQRGADAQTHPGPVRALGHPTDAEPPALPPWLRVSPNMGTLAIENGAVRIEVHPLLTFISRSPDRGWTLLANAADRIGPARRYAGTSVDAATTAYHYAGDEPAVLRVATPSDEVVHVEAETALAAAVYSHLNAFTVLQVTGHRRLFVAFSAAPAARIEVMYSEYPVGRPSRFAYVDADRVLHVVEAESGEKGPFTELARGSLPVDATLGITLFDEQQAIVRIELADFARQASTQVSPTAGWGVTENAIEFSLNSDRPGATAHFFITLAGTSVGRGFDSVGHAPGVYQNRLDIRRMPTP